ncbi:MAG: methyltransferase [Eubacteriaceae bacterium]|nr:methyltransferase [Eubacteriaceae bacterium]
MDRIPFSPDELVEAGTFPSATGVMPGAVKFSTPISPKDNYFAAIKKENPLWMIKGGDTAMFAPRVVPDNFARVFVVERQMQTDEEKEFVATVGSPDMFGIMWEYVPVTGGSIVRPGLPALDDANNWKDVITFPDLDSYDWEGAREANIELFGTEQALNTWQLNGMFERLISWMDFENAAMALIDDEQKDALHEIFDKLADLYIDLAAKYKEYFRMDYFYFHDDWGSQRSPFFSLATAREMLVPPLKKIVDACHDMGMLVEFHSCGANAKLVPAMIEIGFDVWNGMSLINDKAAIWEEYGDQIVIGFGAADIGLVGMEVTEEAAIAAAEAFVEKYGPTYSEKPVIVGAPFGPAGAAFNKVIYENSRKMFAGLEAAE